MRILVLTQIIPYPPDSGPKIKTLNVLRYLRQQQHQLHLVSFVRNDQEGRQAAALRDLGVAVTTVPLRRSRLHDARYLAQSLVTGRPFLIQRDARAAFQATVNRLVEAQAFDAVHADQLSMAQFALPLRLPLHVLDAHNAVWRIVQRTAAQQRWGIPRLLAEVEWRKLRRYEGAVCRAFDHTLVVSEKDRQDLADAAASSFPSTVIPIAVDTQELTFTPRRPDAQHLISVATMFYPPNAEGVYWFARTVFPRIRQVMPGIRFYIVGSRPPARIRQLATPESGIQVTGYVEDIAPLLAQSAVMVVPLQAGSGLRVKILEAFARGIPVVSTTIGAEGITVRDGQHLALADAPEDFAHQVLRLVQDPATAAAMARAARHLVETQYDWRQALRGLDALYPQTPATVAVRA
jgi:glycosyltransferase involved in cell wall biosynthesis